MALVTLPHNPTGLRDGTDDQKGSVVLANDQAIIAQVNGNIDRTNVSPSAALPGTVLSNTAGERVPTDRIEDDAITGDKLKDDPTSGHAAAAVNLANHVKDGILNGLKMASGTVGSDKLRVSLFKLNLASAPFSMGSPGGTGQIDVKGMAASYLGGLNQTQITPLHVWLEDATGTSNMKHRVQYATKQAIADHYFVFTAGSTETYANYNLCFAYLVIAST